MDFRQKEAFEPQTGISLLSPDSGNTTDIHVEPGHRRLIAIRVSQDGAHFTGRTLAISLAQNRKALFKMCSQQGEITKKGHSLIRIGSDHQGDPVLLKAILGTR